MFGYDLVRSAEPTVGEGNPDELGMPDMALMVSDVLVAFDHLRHEITILANVFVEDDVDARVRQRRRRRSTTYASGWRSRCRGRTPSAASRPPSPAISAPTATPTPSSAARSTSARATPTRWCRASAGAPTSPVEAFSIYRGLRAINPSPYMYFLDFEDFEIAGASPESLIKVDGPPRRAAPDRRHAPARRRPRRATWSAREELLADEKERAEHVMLVDLARNDLGRVCEYGSVTVDELMVVETYSHVLHIVSSVSGTLRGDVSAMDALRASLPAGTLSGAPKIRAMQIIDELEPVKRGPYGGSVGYLSYTGDLDTCIYIRSAVVKDGRVHVQAGGGIVADSEAGYEVRETEHKAGRGVRRDRAGVRAGGLGMKVLVIDNYDSFTFNLVQYLGELGAEPDVVRNDVATVDELLERGAERLIVSPGPCTPAEAGVSTEAVRRFAEAGTPVLGVCLGHQALAAAFGGKVVRGEPVHGKTAEVEHDGRTIFDGPALAAHRGALPLAGGGPRPAGRARELGAHHGDTVMAIRHRELPGGGGAVPSRVGAHGRGVASAEKLPVGMRLALGLAVAAAAFAAAPAQAAVVAVTDSGLRDPRDAHLQGAARLVHEPDAAPR